MSKSGAILFLSAMSAFLFHEGLPFVVLPPSRTRTTFDTSPWTTAVASSATASARSARGRSSRASCAAMVVEDVCRGDVPTPGWVRMAQRNLARVRVGDQLPDVNVSRLDDNSNVQSFSLRELFGDKKGVLVGVPGAFTPTCSQVHLPEFVDKSAVLATKGAQIVAFVSVNDAFVMKAWEEAQGAKGKVLMLSDGNGDLAASLGMMIDLSQQGMGLRCKRFVCVVEGGVVTHTRVGDEVALVSAATVEKVLEGTNDSAPRNGGLLEKLLGRERESRAAEAATRESEDLLLA